MPGVNCRIPRTIESLNASCARGDPAEGTPAWASRQATLRPTGGPDGPPGSRTRTLGPRAPPARRSEELAVDGAEHGGWWTRSRSSRRESGPQGRVSPAARAAQGFPAPPVGAASLSNGDPRSGGATC